MKIAPMHIAPIRDLGELEAVTSAAEEYLREPTDHIFSDLHRARPRGPRIGVGRADRRGDDLDLRVAPVHGEIVGDAEAQWQRELIVGGGAGKAGIDYDGECRIGRSGDRHGHEQKEGFHRGSPNVAKGGRKVAAACDGFRWAVLQGGAACRCRWQRSQCGSRDPARGLRMSLPNSRHRHSLPRSAGLFVACARARPHRSTRPPKWRWAGRVTRR